jgi:hypothetical protein
VTISFSFSVDDVVLAARHEAAIEAGTLANAENTYFQYICQTDDGGHDPEGTPDDRVRESHRALHATVWRVDDPLAPIPPLGFGCRCGMRYCAAPDAPNIVAQLIGAIAPTKPTTVPAAFSKWLDANVTGWEAIAEKATKEKKADRLGAIYLMLKAKEISGDLRAIATMIAKAADII